MSTGRVRPPTDQIKPQAAGDIECLTGHPGRIAGGEVNHRGGDVLRLADTSERGLLFRLFFEFAVFGDDAGGSRAFRLDHSGIDGVDANLTRGQFFGQLTGLMVSTAALVAP